MENEKQLTESESIDVIQRMIQHVKNDIEDDSFYYLLWGWLVFIASSVQYVLIQLEIERSYIAWIIMMPIGAIASVIYGRNQNKNKKVKTYIDEVMGFVLISFLVSLCIVLFFQGMLKENCYPMVMMVYGIWLFVSGGAIKFKPLIIGGIINWVLCIAAFFFAFETQLLLLALAVLLGYIIPGHMLKSHYKKMKAA